MPGAAQKTGNMDYITEQLKTPVKGEYDLIVVGGGPAGIGAAITAGRKGLKTLLIERYGFLGGSWTAAFVNPFFDTANKTGLVQELTSDLRKENAFGYFWNITYDFETMKRLLDQKIREAGVQVLFHTEFETAVMQQNTVQGVVVHNKGGRMAFLAKYVLDCTGDGDVAVSAGAEYIFGNEKGGDPQAMTTMFLISGISFKQNKPEELNALMQKACREHNTGYKIDFDKPYAIWLPVPGMAVVQLVHIRGKSGVDPFELSEAEFLGRDRVYETFAFFKKYIPEFKNAYLVATAPQIGVRETRHILGDYYLTDEDIVSGAEFQDHLGFRVNFNVDIHDAREEQECRHIVPYQIPLRCLLPKGINGLLTAGRCISGSFYAHASYRVTGDCVAMGEGAATAIAKALNAGCDIRKIKQVF